jgi:hypothetical protein
MWQIWCYVTKLLNFFPAKNKISDTLSPKAILSSKQINFNHYKLPFGSYCHVHKDTAPWNSLVAQTQGAISLGWSGKIQYSKEKWHAIVHDEAHACSSIGGKFHLQGRIMRVCLCSTRICYSI